MSEEEKREEELRRYLEEDEVYGTKKSRKKERKKKVEFKRQETIYVRGVDIEELRKKDILEQANYIPARQRRSIIRGLKSDRGKLFQKIIKKSNLEEDQLSTIRTHSRDVRILRSAVGKKVAVHNGKVFEEIVIKKDMIGHYLGEFCLTRKLRKHSKVGKGATKGTKHIGKK